VRRLEYTYPLVRADLEKLPYWFEGTLNPAEGLISGSFGSKEYRTPLALKRTLAPSAIPAPLSEAEYAPRKGSALQGYWKGTIATPLGTMRMKLKIAELTNGVYRAEADSIDQPYKEQPVSVSFDPPGVKLALWNGTGMFEGEIDDSQSSMVGDAIQSGQRMPMSLERADPKADRALETEMKAEKNYAYAAQSDLQGHWRATSQWNPLGQWKIKSKLLLNIARLPDGSFAAALTDDRASDFVGVPASVIRCSSPNVFLEWRGLGFTFDGRLRDGKLSGVGRSPSSSFPLRFERKSVK
jgi:hypothetical protein